jgi:hypothetical protein
VLSGVAVGAVEGVTGAPQPASSPQPAVTAAVKRRPGITTATSS